ncbi:ral guanine nucleotide dissociation stimulator-like 2 [Aquila chrysaetos chrysaetos]|uniref:ral guanine nucleotide dissociation stimulator-like 2 n=1 Tax=Aquila chrysaetos chrysaetos TaxID=223781 RepID=UPI001176B4BF|nr:ral guanine nucleotide dissociation stimulator-like 2 [Aquila chrysaetos chrysaetos]
MGAHGDSLVVEERGSAGLSQLSSAPGWTGTPKILGDPKSPPLAEGLIRVLGPDSEAARRLENLGGLPQSAPPPEEEEEEGDEDEEGDADPLDILSFQAQEVAEQLTLTEAELFLRLVPYECLGALWSQRDKRGREGACPSVRATVRQFNRLAGAVVRSCLGGVELRPPPARPPAREVDPGGRGVPRVEELLLALRHHLGVAVQPRPPAPAELGRDQPRCPAQLRGAQCHLLRAGQLQREPPAAAPGPPPQSPPPAASPAAPPQQRSVGVVPYLGTFLRDLVMLDAAMKDELEDGYINFDKRRKEFEVLAQVRGLQGLCRGYRLHPQPRFRRWLRTLRPLPEARRLLRSVGTPSVTWDQPCPPDVLVSPPSGPPPAALAPGAGEVAIGVGAGQGGRPPPAAVPVPPPRDIVPPPGVTDVQPLVAQPSPPKAGGDPGGGGGRPGGAPPTDCRIIRARMELHNGSLYKSILITSQDKTPAVVAKVLEKHGQDPGAAPRFQLLQLLPENRELLLPPSANVFYAMTGTSLDFALRPRELGGGPGLCPPPISTPGGRAQLHLP